MKKLFSLVLIGLMSLVCVACETKYETAICTRTPEDAAGISYEITLEAENGIIQTFTQVANAELIYFQENDLKSIEEMIDSIEETYKNYSGVQYSAEIKDNKLYYETLVIDLTNAATIDGLKQNGLLPIEAKANKTSLKKTVKQLESVGWDIEMK